MTTQFNPPYSTVFDANGAPVSGARAEFYTSGTNIPADVFSDADLETPFSPTDLKTNAAGRFPRIFMASGIYRVLFKYPDGTTLDSWDDYDPGLSAALGNGSALPIAQGGTGSTTDAAARTALGVPSQGQVTALANTTATNTTKIATGLNASDPTRFGLLAPKDSVSRDELAAGFGSFDLQAPVYVSTSANTAINSTIPLDSSIPQIGEGTQLFSQSFTPVSATSKLIIEGSVFGGSGNNSSIIAALFKGASADAVCVAYGVFNNSWSINVPFHFEQTTGATSAVTWSVRVGGTFKLNSYDGTNNLGGLLTSWLRIRETAVV